MLEVDKLFIPGASGSPILNSQTRQVIGYVHGYRTFALNSNVEVTEDVEIGEESAFRKEKVEVQASSHDVRITRDRSANR